MSLILGIALTAAAAIAGTVLCPSRTVPSTNQRPIPGYALALVLAACFVITVGPASAGAVLKGQATVIDGSTLAIDGVSVTLFGVVTPAPDATCWDAHEAPYACGRQIRAELSSRIGTETLTCEPRERLDDRPAEAVCRVGAEDLGDWLINRGYAMPSSDAPASYRQASDRAWGRRAGLWSGVFDDPSNWWQAAR